MLNPTKILKATTPDVSNTHKNRESSDNNELREASAEEMLEGLRDSIEIWKESRRSYEYGFGFRSHEQLHQIEREKLMECDRMVQIKQNEAAALEKHIFEAAEVQKTAVIKADKHQTSSLSECDDAFCETVENV